MELILELSSSLIGLTYHSHLPETVLFVGTLSAKLKENVGIIGR